MAIKTLNMITRNMQNSILHFNISTNGSVHFFNEESRVSYFKMHKIAQQNFAEVFEHPNTNKLTVEKVNWTIRDL